MTRQEKEYNAIINNAINTLPMRLAISFLSIQFRKEVFTTYSPILREIRMYSFLNVCPPFLASKVLYFSNFIAPRMSNKEMRDFERRVMRKAQVN